MEFKVPGIEYMVSAFGIAMVLLLIAAAVFRNHVRINGTATWLLYTLIAPLPALGAITLAGILVMPTNAAIYSVSTGTLLGLFWIHTFLPALLPDFQTENFSVSCVLAVLFGISVLVAGTATGTFPAGLVGHQSDTFGKTSTTWQDGSKF